MLTFVVAVLVAVVIVAVLVPTILAKRDGYSGIGGNTIVRCRQGHLFTTIWIPGASIKAIRLGWFRFQHCPVGQHWTLVIPVKDSDLTDEERRIAGQHHDVTVP